MKLKDLLSINIAPDIYVTTADHHTYFSLNAGQTFTASIFNSGDSDLTNDLLNRNVKYFKPTSESSLEITVE